MDGADEDEILASPEMYEGTLDDGTRVFLRRPRYKQAPITEWVYEAGPMAPRLGRHGPDPHRYYSHHARRTWKKPFDRTTNKVIQRDGALFKHYQMDVGYYIRVRSHLQERFGNIASPLDFAYLLTDDAPQ